MKTFTFRMLLFFVLVTFVNKNAMTQNNPSVNHIAVYVFDLKKSTDFYKNVMQFEEIPEPFHDGKHVWFRIGKHTQLHIIEGAKAVMPHDINSHFAYTVPVLEKFITHLNEAKVAYQNFKGDSKEPQVRPDGIKQVYLQDPDNYWIEVNDDRF